MKRIIATDRAPKAIGPYSQAVVGNGLVFASGQIPLDPVTGILLEGDITAQTERVLENLKAVIEAAGSSMDRVLRVTVFLKDVNEFAAMNEVYARYFGSEPPSRSTIEAARLPRGAKVEMDAVALAG